MIEEAAFAVSGEMIPVPASRVHCIPGLNEAAVQRFRSLSRSSPRA